MVAMSVDRSKYGFRNPRKLGSLSQEDRAVFISDPPPDHGAVVSDGLGGGGVSAENFLKAGYGKKGLPIVA
jgi:hypothetical protein